MSGTRWSIHRVSGGRYRQVSRLPSGGTADVSLVEELDSQTLWVAKAYRMGHAPSWKEWELFERGARVMETLNHPGIPRFKELIKRDGSDGTPPGLWLIEEYIAGKNLEQLVGTGPGLGLEQSVKSALGILSSLAYLHGRQPPIVHRDVKPSNAIMRPDGTVALIDFGAVQNAIRSCTTGGSTVVGTYGYMPPEQYMGRAEPRSDLYGLGATLLYLLTGREPHTFEIRDMRIRFEHLFGDNASIVPVLKALLSPRVEARTASAADAARALKALLVPGGATRPVSTQSGTDRGQIDPTLAAFMERHGDEPITVVEPSDPRIGQPGVICPACGAQTTITILGPQSTEVDTCSECGGIWLDRGELEMLITRPLLTRPDIAEIRRQVRAMRTPPDPVVYRPCPRCNLPMSRRNFGRMSGVVLDECVQHGIWLDETELARIQKFVSVGGLELRESALRHDIAFEASARKENVRHGLMKSLVARRGSNSATDLLNLLLR